MKTSVCARQLIRETEKVIVGKRETIELVIAAVFSGGHVLLEDLPGSGKTTLVKTLAAALGCSYSRIQFTPDLLPADVVGMTVFNQKTGDFELHRGPVYTNLLLADEINRAIPRTQSALLEAMEERQVTIDGETSPLPDPFFVMATQNPTEKDSTFPLPAAQTDRFFVRLSMGYPSLEEEIEMLAKVGGSDLPDVEAVTSPQVLVGLRAEIEDVFVDASVSRYIVELVHATRSHADVAAGASPRASRSLFQGARTLAAMADRDYVIPEDVQRLAAPVLCHRITLTGEARYRGKTAEDVVAAIVDKVPVPPEGKACFS